MIENVTQIEQTLGLEEGAIKSAIESEENVTINVPTGKFYEEDKFVIKSLEDHEKFVENLKGEQKNAGLEIAIKEAKRELGYDFDGKKDINQLLQFHANKVLEDAKIEPDTKIQELSSDKEKLQATNRTLQEQIDQLVQDGKAKDNQRRIDDNILGSINGELTLSKGQIATLFKSEYSVVEDEGKLVVQKGGETLKDSTNLDPLSVGDVLGEFTKQFAKQAEGGAGGGDTNAPGKAGTLEAFNEEMAKKGINQNSEEYNQEMMKRIADNTLNI